MAGTDSQTSDLSMLKRKWEEKMRFIWKRIKEMKWYLEGNIGLREGFLRWEKWQVLTWRWQWPSKGKIKNILPIALTNANPRDCQAKDTLISTRQKGKLNKTSHDNVSLSAVLNVKCGLLNSDLGPVPGLLWALDRTFSFSVSPFLYTAKGWDQTLPTLTPHDNSLKGPQ